jgi:hypothetical protein
MIWLNRARNTFEDAVGSLARQRGVAMTPDQQNSGRL